MWNLSGALSYSFSPIVVMNLSGGWIDVDLSEYKLDNSYQSGAIGHLNVVYSPVKSVNIGVEYQIAQRVNKDLKSGVANRIQIAAKYIF